jgi:hypothetical protein
MSGKSLKFLVGFVGLLCLMAYSDMAFGYSGAGSYSWDASTPGYSASATLHSGTIDTSLWSIMGDFVGRSSTNPNAGFYGDSGVSVGWDDTWVGNVGNPNTNGDARDGLWVQIYSDGGWWDMGRQVSRIAVSTSQDHGPYLGEGLEYRIYATNTLWDSTSLTPQIPVSDVYLDGWRTHNAAEDNNNNDWLSDDITGIYNLGGSYQYIKLVAWGASPYDEPEVDAIAAPIPEPSTIILLGLGVLGLLGYGWRRRK